MYITGWSSVFTNHNIINFPAKLPQFNHRLIWGRSYTVRNLISQQPTALLETATRTWTKQGLVSFEVLHLYQIHQRPRPRLAHSSRPSCFLSTCMHITKSQHTNIKIQSKTVSDNKGTCDWGLWKGTHQISHQSPISFAFAWASPSLLKDCWSWNNETCYHIAGGKSSSKQIIWRKNLLYLSLVSRRNHV